jgi:predicted NBD/HSP70 family sugar kinase
LWPINGDRVEVDIPTPERPRMSFERAQGATSRADQTTVRRANLGVVLQQIAGGAPRSRARVAAETGLTRGTVSSLVGELIELDLLRETGEGDHSGRVGRPAQTLELGDRIVAVGLEVNVDYLAVCVEDLTGTIRQERHVHADNRRSQPGPVLSRLARMAEQALAAAAADDLVPVGIAVALPGVVEEQTGTLLRAPNLGWSEIAVAAEIAARLPGLPVRADNEANLAALAEHWQGAARGLDDFIYVFGEVGVGGGIFVDGELFRGAHGYGGELGHVTVEPDGPHCNCGARGCLETLVGQEAIARRAGISFGAGSRMRNLTGELVRRARKGDRAVLQSLTETGRYLGIGLASAVNLFDVDAVVLGGCFGPLFPWLADDVRRMLEERVLTAAWSGCELRPSEFGEGASVRGAAALTLRSVLAEPWLVAEGSYLRPVKVS